MSHTVCDMTGPVTSRLVNMGLLHTDAELAAAAAQLLADVVANPDGTVSPSPYETGRLVSHAPWLPGHEARLEFLHRTQNPDGSWGGPDGYALVPTLSATAGLLAELSRRQAADQPGDQALVGAAKAGLRSARRWLDPGAGQSGTTTIPDTVAVELMVPALLAELIGLLPASVGDLLRLPDGFDQQPLDVLRARLRAGRPLPEPAYHFLELFGPVAATESSARLAAGAIGASPAATATWLGGLDGPPAAHQFLLRTQARTGGPAPNVTPITYFEAAWVLNSLAVGGLAYQPPVELLERLASGLTEAGAPAGPGLPVDADDTAAVLAALLRHGRTPSPDSLSGFWADGYFRCFAGERNPSVSTNANVLEALCLYLTRPTCPAGLTQTAATTATWLRDQQQPDGSWWDKWHASPYYPTACCVTALVLHSGPYDQAAVDRAVSWVRATQRSDGSWGRWTGTVEETAYALQVLCLAGVAGGEVRRGAAFLAQPPLLAQEAPLWHGKDLYTPVLVVQAARLAALQLASQCRTAASSTHIPNPRRPTGAALRTDQRP